MIEPPTTTATADPSPSHPRSSSSSSSSSSFSLSSFSSPSTSYPEKEGLAERKTTRYTEVTMSPCFEERGGGQREGEEAKKMMVLRGRDLEKDEGKNEEMKSVIGNRRKQPHREYLQELRERRQGLQVLLLRKQQEKQGEEEESSRLKKKKKIYERFGRLEEGGEESEARDIIAGRILQETGRREEREGDRREDDVHGLKEMTDKERDEGGNRELFNTIEEIEKELERVKKEIDDLETSQSCCLSEENEGVESKYLLAWEPHMGEERRRGGGGDATTGMQEESMRSQERDNDENRPRYEASEERKETGDRRASVVTPESLGGVQRRREISAAQLYLLMTNLNQSVYTSLYLYLEAIFYLPSSICLLSFYLSIFNLSFCNLSTCLYM